MIRIFTGTVREPIAQPAKTPIVPRPGMRSRRIRDGRLVFAAILVAAASPARAADWPCFRGPNRDAICTETKLLNKWPEAGPTLLWRSEQIGQGFYGISVVGSLLYTMGERNGAEWLIAVDCANQGRVIWAYPIGPIRQKGAGSAGPRCTPAAYRDRVYALGVAGDLVCADAMSGEMKWRRNLVVEFGGVPLKTGYSESPLIDGNWILCTPGGSLATVLALWRLNGQKVWAAPIGDPASGASLLKVSLGDVQQYVQLTAAGLVGVRVRGGGLLWRWDQPAGEPAPAAKPGAKAAANPARPGAAGTPIWFGQTLFAGGEGAGSGVVWPLKHGDEFLTKEMYFKKDFLLGPGGAVCWNGSIYACANPNKLSCLDYKTGQVRWQDETCGRCSLLFADGMLYARDEAGPVSLVRATPEKFELRGRFSPPIRGRKQSWVHPVISGGKLYLREQSSLFCYDVVNWPKEADEKKASKETTRAK